MLQRLDLEALIDATVRLDGRAGATAKVLGHRVMAPSTIGTFLRSFTFGQCRQIEAVIGHALERVRSTDERTDETRSSAWRRARQASGRGRVRRVTDGREPSNEHYGEP